jgi:hypothetical protein
MPRFRVEVIEHITCRYEPVWVEAGDEHEARVVAEEMRVQGVLDDVSGDSIEDVTVDILETIDEEV